MLEKSLTREEWVTMGLSQMLCTIGLVLVLVFVDVPRVSSQAWLRRQLHNPWQSYTSLRNPHNQDHPQPRRTYDKQSTGQLYVRVPGASSHTVHGGQWKDRYQDQHSAGTHSAGTYSTHEHEAYKQTKAEGEHTEAEQPYRAGHQVAAPSAPNPQPYTSDHQVAAPSAPNTQAYTGHHAAAPSAPNPHTVQDPQPRIPYQPHPYQRHQSRPVGPPRKLSTHENIIRFKDMGSMQLSRRRFGYKKPFLNYYDDHHPNYVEHGGQKHRCDGLMKDPHGHMTRPLKHIMCDMYFRWGDATKKPARNPMTAGQKAWGDQLGSRSPRRRHKRQTEYNDDRAIRREYRAMSDEQRRRFHDAMNKLKNTFMDGRSKYDILVGYHQASASPGAHFGPAFFGFHRELLFR